MNHLHRTHTAYEPPSWDTYRHESPSYDIYTTDEPPSQDTYRLRATFIGHILPTNHLHGTHTAYEPPSWDTYRLRTTYMGHIPPGTTFIEHIPPRATFIGHIPLTNHLHRTCTYRHEPHS